MKPILRLALISTALVLACESDTTRPQEPAPVPKIKALTTRENVLNNLEVAYNTRKFAPYDELLDPGFTFFFSPFDVGGNIPPQWGRVEELSVANLLFDPSLNDPNYPTCRSIRMDLKLENGVAWVDTVPPAYPTETWYTTTVYYEFTFEMAPDYTYIAVPGSRAQFTVRNIGTDDAPQWRLVEWRDLASSSLLSTTAMSPTTWGTVKALYI